LLERRGADRRELELGERRGVERRALELGERRGAERRELEVPERDGVRAAREPWLRVLPDLEFVLVRPCGVLRGELLARAGPLPLRRDELPVCLFVRVFV
jgi:hypothetical protein